VIARLREIPCGWGGGDNPHIGRVTLWPMNFNMTTVLVILTLCSAIYLLMNYGDRMVPTIAVIAAGIWTAVVFGVMSLTLAKFRIDVIIPAVLVVCGVICWMRTSTKGTTTASTLITFIAGMTLLARLNILS
jgi:hypothetical protein